MQSHICLDESGDLGWKFDSPYRDRGSSRYLTIGYLICPIPHIKIPKRIVRDVYSKFKFNTTSEIKGSSLKALEKDFICNETVKMLNYYRDKLVHLGSNPVSTAPSAVSTGVALGKSRRTLLSAHNAND